MKVGWKWYRRTQRGRLVADLWDIEGFKILDRVYPSADDGISAMQGCLDELGNGFDFTDFVMVATWDHGYDAL